MKTTTTGEGRGRVEQVRFSSETREWKL
jgi:hypothetical protein